MTKSALVVFYQYTPRVDEQYKTQSKWFFKLAKEWSDQLDKFYIVDAGWNFTKDELPENAVVIKEDMNSHWYYLNKLTLLADTDTLLYLDPDILIYDPEVIRTGFEKLKSHDGAGILDNSGSIDLFPANKYRGVRRRFTPYLTFIHSKLLKSGSLYSGIDFTPETGFDSMGRITFEIVRRGCNFYEFEDDRNTLRMDEQGNITKDTWLDGPPYLWSTPQDKLKNLGYYHVRNSSVGLSILNEFKIGHPSYQMRKSTMPFSEVMRLLAWQWRYDFEANEDWSEKYWPVLNDFNVSKEMWLRYIQEMLRYHVCKLALSPAMQDF